MVNETTTEIRISIKTKNVKKLKYLQSFDTETMSILDEMIERLYKSFKTGEKNDTNKHINI
jgi:hypothetical protein